MRLLQRIAKDWADNEIKRGRIKRGTDTVEEYRVGGKLYMLKVTPATGASYYLVDEKGDGKMTRQDSFDSGVRPPMWVIHSW